MPLPIQVIALALQLCSLSVKFRKTQLLSGYPPGYLEGFRFQSTRSRTCVSQVVFMGCRHFDCVHSFGPVPVPVALRTCG